MTDRSYAICYGAIYKSPLTKDGRELLMADIRVMQNAKSGKLALEQCRLTYQEEVPHGSLTGMNYADEIDKSVTKNSMSVTALKGRFLVSVSLTYPDSSERGNSARVSKDKSRRIMVDTLASKLLKRAGAQTWPDLGKRN